MLFNSLQFWIFFIVVILAYYVLPQKCKWVCLLISSYIFYLLCNIKATFILLMLTIIVYFAAKGLENKEEGSSRRRLLVATVVAILFILAIFKYFNFFIDNANYLLTIAGRNFKIPYRNLLLPVGISFYSFKAISYVLEVAWHRRKAENSVGKLALYLAFFPQVMSGPIDRPDNFFEQLKKDKKFWLIDWDEVILQIGWGLFEKLVIADRLGMLVDTVYKNYSEYAGWQIGFASICFTLQILCDFDGYSNIAIGVSKAFGFCTKKNFDLPYFSLSIKEFWRRWHISLSSWFRDYLYIPLGGNRKGKIRKHINIMVVFLCSGLWHGAGWNYIIWGGLHGIYQIIGDITSPIKKKIYAALHISTEVASFKLMQGVITFFLVNFAWIFFKIEDMSVVRDIIKKMCHELNLGTIFRNNVFYSMGLDEKEFKLVMIALGIWLMISLFQKYIVDLLDAFKRQNLMFKWIIYYMLIFGVIIFGAYGGNYSASNFIYISF